MARHACVSDAVYLLMQPCDCVISNHEAENGAVVVKGQILDFSVQENTGVISGEDDKRYQFIGADWKGDRSPARGMTIDFDIEGEHAKEVYLVLSETVASDSPNRMTAGLLAIFLGGWGIHKFYLGFSNQGLVFLLTNTVGFLFLWPLLFLPNIAVGIIAFIEGITYLTKSDEEFERIYVVEKKRWF